jgi:hypothetical protein
VEPIVSLKQKTAVAVRAGITTIICPEANRAGAFGSAVEATRASDLACDVDVAGGADAVGGAKYIFVSTLLELLQAALVEPDWDEEEEEEEEGDDEGEGQGEGEGGRCSRLACACRGAGSRGDCVRGRRGARGGGAR